MTDDNRSPMLIVMILFASYGVGVGIVLGWLIWG
jgi:hypothetical protein